MLHRSILSAFQSPMWVIIHLKANKNTSFQGCFILCNWEYFFYLYVY
ncbi:hypothetical protein [Enterococcus phage vB_Efs19_KEN07]